MKRLLTAVILFSTLSGFADPRQVTTSGGFFWVFFSLEIEMAIKKTINDTRVPVHIWTDEVEQAAETQLRNIASLPFIHHHVAAMPDVHLGIGATVGSVIPTHKAIIPASVGVDIGCGMMAIKTSLTARHLPDNLAAVRHAIERSVPVGFHMHKHERVATDSAQEVSAGLHQILDKYPKLISRTARTALRTRLENM